MTQQPRIKGLISINNPELFFRFILFLWTYIVVFLPSLLIISFLLPPVSSEVYGSYLGSQIPDLRFLLFVSLFLPGIGFLIGLKRKKIKMVRLSRLSKEQILTYFGLSFIITYFIWRYTLILPHKNILIAPLMVSFLLFYLPQVMVFINSVQFTQLTKFIGSRPETSQEMIEVLKRLTLLLSAVIVIHLGVLAGNNLFQKAKQYQVYLSRLSHIDRIEPYLVYPASKAVIYGWEFDWKENSKVRLMTDKGEAVTDFWSDSKIVFTVPLHLQKGPLHVWIEKPLVWQGKNQVVKSNKKVIKVLSSVGPFGPDDDNYYKQFQYLDKQTLKDIGKEEVKQASFFKRLIYRFFKLYL